MKNYHMIMVFIAGLVLSACSGSGGATPAAVTDTYTGLYVGGGEAGVASVNEDEEYTYFFNGVPVDVTLSGTTPIGGFVDRTEGAIAKHIGGTTYSYSRFGVVASISSPMSGSSITPAATAPDTEYVDGEVFYVGQKTSSMPATGTATYSGYLTTLQDGEFNDAAVTFAVDYGDKTISGDATLDGTNMTFDEDNIIGSDFSGTMLSGAAIAGEYHGSFFGPNAEELGGAGTFDGGEGTFGFSFGAEKEL
jgi:hypothetical protein